jgi:hypothetical protein
MRADAETTWVLYFVEPPEHVVLQELERDVLSVLSTNQMEGHATWVNKLDAANDRFVHRIGIFIFRFPEDPMTQSQGGRLRVPGD